jgi:cold shock CspA family protein
MSQAQTRKGVVAHFNAMRGFGFIACNEPQQRFFHVRDIAGDLQPAKGDVVSFDPATRNGKPVALRVALDAR